MRTPRKQIRAGIYLRISRDPLDKRTGVARQLKDCKELSADLAWPIEDIFDENNVSATRGVQRRKEYQRLTADIRSGRINALIFWEHDRFTRDVRETEDLLDLARDLDLRAASTSGGELDLTSPQGRYNTTMAGASARKETEQLSKRLRSEFARKAAAGLPHGAVPYGWRRERELDKSGNIVSSRDVLDPVESQVILDAVEMLRAGTSLRATAKALNDRGLFSPRLSHADAHGERHPIPWASATLKQVLLRSRNAGLRRHRGRVLEGVTGEWPVIFDIDTYDWLVGHLTDPARRTTKGSTRRHLLTGLMICGRCGSDRTTVNVRPAIQPGRKHQPSAYVCSACTRIRRKQADVDAVVEDYMIQLLETPGALDKLIIGDPAEVEKARAAKAAALSRMEVAADQFANGTWTAEQVNRVNAVAQPQIDTAQAVIDSNQPRALPFHVAGPDAADNWAAASLDEKRTLIRALVTITIQPSTPGKSFDPELIDIRPV